MKYSIESTNFDVCLQLKVFEADIKYSSNTDMDIDIKEFVTFVDALSSLYTTLNGIAIIQEPYGERQFIEFSAERSGHIGIRGKLSSNGRGGFVQELSFENSIDQTYLPDFINNLSSLCTKYR